MSMTLLVEVFFLRLEDGRVVYHKHVVDVSSERGNPDDEVLGLVVDETGSTPKMIGDNFVIHSTSWR